MNVTHFLKFITLICHGVHRWILLIKKFAPVSKLLFTGEIPTFFLKHASIYITEQIYECTSNKLCNVYKWSS